MKGFIAKISLTALCVLTIFSAFGAGKITFEANAPMLVAAGEAFRVEFTVNETPEDDSFVAPSFEGFEQLAGPVFSTGRYFEAVNGSMTASVKVTVSYMLVCNEPGNVTIGSAEVVVDERTYRTKALPIEVVAEDVASARQQNDDREQAPTSGAQKRVGKDDILLRASVSRSTVFKGEPLRVVFKLYQRINIAGVDEVKFPSFNGFWAQELANSNTRSQRETVNGKIYETTVIKEYLLYPQLAGALTIDPAKLTAVAQVVVPSKNPDPFFGGPEVYNVRVPLQTPKLTVAVKELPSGAPASFSGAVGRFTMDATLPADHLAANSSATYIIKIAGTGNLTFVQAPKLTLPGSFEQYNVKASESINASASGMSGYRQFEYPFIARAAGEYNIPAMEFSYFDPANMRYTTLSTKALSLEITPDVSGSADGAPVVVGRGLSKEDVKLLGEDIRFIKLGGPQLHARSVPFIFSTAYFILLGGILVLAAMVYMALRKQIRDSQNAALLRGKRANKVAVQRFRAAKRYMVEQNQHAFYEEMLRALWGYMGDKFNIPVANLTKENVREELHKRSVTGEESQRFTAIITKCDEAQYSPMASAQMSDVYAEGLGIVSRLEAVIKR